VAEADFVVLPWRRAFRLAYGLAMIAFAAVLGYLAFRTGQFQTIHRTVMAGAAALLGYSVLVQLVNHTVMHVDGVTLLIEHGPLPWRGRLRIGVSEVRALRCDPHSRRLLLRTALGEEHIILADLRADDLSRIDEQIRACLRIGNPS
jgi:hypothetical protein